MINGIQHPPNAILQLPAVLDDVTYTYDEVYGLMKKQVGMQKALRRNQQRLTASIIQSGSTATVSPEAEADAAGANIQVQPEKTVKKNNEENPTYIVWRKVERQIGADAAASGRGATRARRAYDTRSLARVCVLVLAGICQLALPVCIFYYRHVDSNVFGLPCDMPISGLEADPFSCAALPICGLQDKATWEHYWNAPTCMKEDEAWWESWNQKFEEIWWRLKNPKKEVDYFWKQQTSNSRLRHSI